MLNLNSIEVFPESTESWTRGLFSSSIRIIPDEELTQPSQPETPMPGLIDVSDSESEYSDLVDIDSASDTEEKSPSTQPEEIESSESSKSSPVEQQLSPNDQNASTSQIVHQHLNFGMWLDNKQSRSLYDPLQPADRQLNGEGFMCINEFL